jgi:chromosome segregation ATPase
VSRTLSLHPVTVPLRPLAETAALFREECHALDHLVEELYRDVEQLRDELVRKSDEIDEGRKKLAERGRQLAEQRKESGRLVALLEQQEQQLTQALAEIKSLRDEAQRHRQEAEDRSASHQALLEQDLRTLHAERDQLRHELHLLQAAASADASGGAVSADLLSPLMGELSDMRRQLADTQSQLDDARRQLAAAIDQSTAAIQQSAAAREAEARLAREGEAPAEPLAPALLSELSEMRRQVDETQKQLAQTQSQLVDAHAALAAGIDRAATAAEQARSFLPASSETGAADPQTQERLASLERERIELESELELVRTRATELQEVVNQQRRELVEQRADVTTELRLLRELVEQNRHVRHEEPLEEEPALVGASSRGEPVTCAPDPVVSSVMAQFARLQKDVAQRRRKK